MVVLEDVPELSSSLAIWAVGKQTEANVEGPNLTMELHSQTRFRLKILQVDILTSLYIPSLLNIIS